jgi:hypothetical protein
MREEKQAQRQSGEEEEEQLSGILILELINNNSINAITISERSRVQRSRE